MIRTIGIFTWYLQDQDDRPGWLKDFHIFFYRKMSGLSAGDSIIRDSSGEIHHASNLDEILVETGLDNYEFLQEASNVRFLELEEDLEKVLIDKIHFDLEQKMAAKEEYRSQEKVIEPQPPQTDRRETIRNAINETKAKKVIRTVINDRT